MAKITLISSKRTIGRTKNARGSSRGLVGTVASQLFRILIIAFGINDLLPGGHVGLPFFFLVDKLALLLARIVEAGTMQ
jgi:hypothetical protein